MEKRDITQHISQKFNEELVDIRSRVMRMGGLVEQQLTDAVAALAHRDQTLAEQVVANDHKINAMEVDLDEECTHILARRQPTASDLRLVMAVIKTITDLERIGDEAERIGRMAKNLLQVEAFPESIMTEIRTLGERVSHMLHGCLDAFARMDAEQAVKVAKEDILADREYEAIMRKLLQLMMDSPNTVPSAMDVVWAARSLERIGDRARNICEYVIYFVKGKDVRHTSFDNMEKQAGPGGRKG